MTPAGDKEVTKPAVDNREIARVLQQIADLLEFQDADFFKLRSYRLAAETIEAMQDSIGDMANHGGAKELQKIPGIGKSISTQILEIIATGTSSAFEALQVETPITVLDLRRVPGVGLKIAQLIYREFGVKNLEDLQAFVEGGGLHAVPGLGEKTRHRIQTALARSPSAA
jgi:DNA polymerase (family 10)